MARLTDANLAIAHDIVGRYPRARSALIPLCHLAQEQDGWLSPEAMEHIAELVGCTPAEVLGTASFYEMFKLEPVGQYLVNICTNISCQLLGARELLHHAEESLGIRPGNTTSDGLFTLEDVECIAACTEAPCMQVNYRYFMRLSHEDFDAVIADLRAGRNPTRGGAVGDAEVPSHGTLAVTRQSVAAHKSAGNADPDVSVPPGWFPTDDSDDEDGS
ncbi:MAG: NAD(P)H-dependent oxidoreductase subunit E [Actinomycetota bacterium]|nr:NAD(P)H-dependent oxidoreductase subunit E [Actinomycetota bacterium]